MLPWWMGVMISWVSVYVVAITSCSLVWLMFRRVRQHHETYKAYIRLVSPYIVIPLSCFAIVKLLTHFI
ncbi:hypothetical protein SAMN05443507_1206 [Alicyclobacillus tolerans]|uniref:Uncharacterized protein n=1 Tax=Alicyclobacillus tolerans TaxID=90970 RepID=A0A1M6UJU1_9BACL|nr:hypothetical protein SAMN05443507_1206 [Alicyclobacillus montanus]